ncbi:hypothetical protein C8Q75DRAFT_414681 [Abortiporus biennis]|nr:hypothetical protein C8Q75DRAFT_414681 [Abortiporus biennis]
MPADRTRGSKRGTTDGELTWTTPLDATKPASIAFAPNITPGTFNDPPTPVDPPAESMLFPPNGEAPASNKRNAHSKKKPVDHIPRPPNAFILFRSSFIKNQHVSSEVETNHSTLSKIIGLTWQNLPHEERQIWHAKAKAALDEHKKKFPEYAFRPLHTKGKGAADKRKVREVGPKDMERCAAIADLLVQGKKGADLEAAIAEFDKTHVPKIVTRFEAPITARSYRRSSSAPVPDTEHSKPTFLPSPIKSHKPRSSSSEPDSSSRLDATLDYSTPSSSSSQCDLDTASEYQCDSPASLSVASPSTYIPLTPTNPSLVS